LNEDVLADTSCEITRSENIFDTFAGVNSKEDVNWSKRLGGLGLECASFYRSEIDATNFPTYMTTQSLFMTAHFFHVGWF
jgi:hypothetical protein